MEKTFEWVEGYGKIRSILNEHIVKPLYSVHHAATEHDRIEREAEEELERILERGESAEAEKDPDQEESEESKTSKSQTGTESNKPATGENADAEASGSQAQSER